MILRERDERRVPLHRAPSEPRRRSRPRSVNVRLSASKWRATASAYGRETRRAVRPEALGRDRAQVSSRYGSSTCWRPTCRAELKNARPTPTDTSSRPARSRRAVSRRPSKTRASLCGAGSEAASRRISSRTARLDLEGGMSTRRALVPETPPGPRAARRPSPVSIPREARPHGRARPRTRRGTPAIRVRRRPRRRAPMMWREAERCYRAELDRVACTLLTASLLGSGSCRPRLATCRLADELDRDAEEVPRRRLVELETAGRAAAARARRSREARR